MPRLRRLLPACTAAVLASVGFVAVAPASFAVAVCNATTPTLDQMVTCVTAGTETITIPVGANRVEVIVIGGGGHGGALAYPSTGSGGDGGDGAEVAAVLRVDAGGLLSVVVGAGAVAYDGEGGRFSSVTASDVLVVAGGGGGGGISAGTPAGSGGSGAQGGSPAGGDGGDQGGSTTNGGAGGSDGAGGGGGSGGGFTGSSWAAGGAGGIGFGVSAGSGGSGYGGGGGGGDRGPTTTAYPGGGAGGSYVNQSLLIGTASFQPSTAAAGQGGAGATSSGASGAVGTAGSVTLIFRYVAPSGPVDVVVTLPASPVQQVPVPSSGSCADVDASTLAYGTDISGGWSSSWAEWAQGPVCTRTLTYSESTGSWSAA